MREEGTDANALKMGTSTLLLTASTPLSLSRSDGKETRGGRSEGVRKEEGARSHGLSLEGLGPPKGGRPMLPRGRGELAGEGLFYLEKHTGREKTQAKTTGINSKGNTPWTFKNITYLHKTRSRFLGANNILQKNIN